MNNTNSLRIILILFASVLLLIPFLATGCQEEEEQPPAPEPSPVLGIDLSRTLVPNADFDVYVYVKQREPTVVLKDMLGTPTDIAVDSLALWGVATDDTFNFAGSLTLATSNEAADLHNQVPDESKIWTSLSDATFYFVYEAGGIETALKTAISNKDFKNYDNQEALHELSYFPEGGETRLAGIGVVRPSLAVVELLAKYAAPNASDLMEVLLKTANLQVLTAGLYSAEQVDIAEISRKADLASILELDVGILASAKSGWPGIVVTPIVGNALEAAGYDKVAVGELTIYKGYLDIGNGNTIPVLLRVKDNRLFAAVASKESYAETLITNLNL